MYQQLWGYKVEDKLYLGVRGKKRLNTTALADKNPRQHGSVPWENLCFDGFIQVGSILFFSRYKKNFLVGPKDQEIPPGTIFQHR
jgi:hypothetical protein